MATIEDIDQMTQAWIRNESDRRAASRGCRFDAERGAWTVWWIERHCRLYEGCDGDPMILRGCHQCGEYGIETPDQWDEEGIDACLERAERFNQCILDGHDIDWQYECVMRLFGWVKWSEKWNREIRRFRESIIFVPKKNKKSPTLAAIGLYLTCGDGEPGQHVFLAAKDGAQAKEIGAKHVIEMLDKSDILLEVCTKNLTTAQVTHEPSRSTIKPLSSSNVRTQKSKEGLNGSILVDEVHVVDREFANRISRAGISRSEPLFGAFSTAGDDPDSYGKERWDYAERILSGEEDNDQVFAAIYAAPHDLKDEDLAADPLKYGKMANPAMGHTVDPEEFLADYKRSRGNPRELALFKMYRLDIWQNSASPWLPGDRWAQGERQFTFDDLNGRECWAGLDLSSVLDFSSLCLCFPEGESFQFLWWYWLPEETAVKYRQRINIDRWLKDTRVNLTLTPGAQIDYRYIKSRFKEICQRYRPHQFVYDQWNATQSTLEFEEETGVPRVQFSQGLAAMNEPTKLFEAAVMAGRVLHNGDPLTRWMVGNATIKPDCNGNYKPLKPDHMSVKKIDGVVVAVMAHAAAYAGMLNRSGTYYETHELEMF